jgi:flagella basal body P-ring formation protein FlgA
MRLRPNIGASIILLLLMTSAIGCQSLCEEQDLEAVFPTRDVVVAAQGIEQGASIENEMLTQRSVPVDETTEMALTDIGSALGKVAAIDILTNQMISPNMLVAE